MGHAAKSVWLLISKQLYLHTDICILGPDQPAPAPRTSSQVEHDGSICRRDCKCMCMLQVGACCSLKIAPAAGARGLPCYGHPVGNIGSEMEILSSSVSCLTHLLVSSTITVLTYAAAQVLDPWTYDVWVRTDRRLDDRRLRQLTTGQPQGRHFQAGNHTQAQQQTLPRRHCQLHLWGAQVQHGEAVGPQPLHLEPCRKGY